MGTEIILARWLFQKLGPTLIINLKNGYSLTKLSRKIKRGYPNTFRYSKSLERRGVIESEKTTRERRVYLTKKGEEIKSSIIKINKIINNPAD